MPRILAAALVMLVTVPVAARAQSATNFDGTYHGVSFEMLVGAGRRCVPPSPGSKPKDLTVAGGVARLPYTKALGTTVVFEGTVAPDGTSTLRNETGDTVTVLFDNVGGVTGRLNYYHGCSYTFVWRKA